MVAAWDIYADKLFPLGYGHPLSAPEPCRQFGEVRIGDVGYLSNGHFRFLFNCTRPEGDPLNLRGTPTPFEPLTIPPGSLAEFPNEITQSLLQSQGMESVTVQGQATIGNMTTQGGAQAQLRYKCAEQSGALLMLKQAGHATRLECTRHIQQYMRQNLEHWHLFATDRLGIDLQASDLVFVYGFTKTTVWAEAAFSSSTTDGELSISAGALPIGASGSFSVELSNCQLPITFHRHGPPERIMTEPTPDSLDNTPSTGVEDPFDQCIFLNYYKMKSRFRRKVIMRAAAGPHELPSAPPDDQPMEIDDTHSGEVYDPATQILDYILARTETADYAWASDEDVGRMLQLTYSFPGSEVFQQDADLPGSSSEALSLAFVITKQGLGMLSWTPPRDAADRDWEELQVQHVVYDDVKDGTQQAAESSSPVFDTPSRRGLSNANSSSLTLSGDGTFNQVNDEEIVRQFIGLEPGKEINLYAVADHPQGQRPIQSTLILTQLAILGSPDRRLKVQEIYHALEERFVWFRQNAHDKSWQGAVRHNLALFPCFKAVYGPDKSQYWTVDCSAGPPRPRASKRNWQRKAKFRDNNLRVDDQNDTNTDLNRHTYRHDNTDIRGTFVSPPEVDDKHTSSDLPSIRFFEQPTPLFGLHGCDDNSTISSNSTLQTPPPSLFLASSESIDISRNDQYWTPSIPPDLQKARIGGCPPYICGDQEAVEDNVSSRMHEPSGTFGGPAFGQPGAFGKPFVEYAVASHGHELSSEAAVEHPEIPPNSSVTWPSNLG